MRCRGASALTALACLVLAGCSTGQPERPPEPIHMLAVLPVEPAPAQGRGGRGAPPPPAEAALAVTAQIYRVLAEQTEFRFVPDLTVADALSLPDVRHADTLDARALALGKQVGADAVIVGRVFRFENRVGTEYGATEPASVSFALSLVSVRSGKELWHGQFDQTQQPLTSNLLNWWMFWSAGPRWMSASELAGLGVDKLFDQMTKAVAVED